MAAITTICTKALDPVHKATAEVVVMMLFTLALSLLLIPFPFFFFWHKQQFHLHSRPLISERPRLNQDTRGLKQRGTCWRICSWNASLRLRPDWAQGGESRRYLFESLHGVWWCPHGCGACYPWIKTQLRWGYVALFKPADVYARMGFVHPPIWPWRWGKTRYICMFTPYKPTIDAWRSNHQLRMTQRSHC